LPKPLLLMMLLCLREEEVIEEQLEATEKEPANPKKKR
jgi:hypothetical protein